MTPQDDAETAAAILRQYFTDPASLADATAAIGQDACEAMFGRKTGRHTHPATHPSGWTLTTRTARCATPAAGGGHES
jgi:hypothetical protein